MCKWPYHAELSKKWKIALDINPKWSIILFFLHVYWNHQLSSKKEKNKTSTNFFYRHGLCRGEGGTLYKTNSCVFGMGLWVKTLPILGLYCYMETPPPPPHRLYSYTRKHWRSFFSFYYWKETLTTRVKTFPYLSLCCKHCVSNRWLSSSLNF